ncbi:unnamed protein product, partial [Heterosigma akashiwo]
GIAWKDTTYLDIIMLFTVMLSISIMGGGPRTDFWSTVACGLIPAFEFGTISGMSRNRFNQILKFFCCYILRPEDLETEGPRKGLPKDKAAKVRWFINVLQHNFRRFWLPGKVWAVDESIIPYLGRLCPFKVFMKDKPHRYGMKLWCSGDTFPGEVLEQIRGLWRFGERVVIFFARELPVGCYIFCDRYFTAPKLCWYCLKQLGVYVTGTLMKSKKNLCADIIFKKAKKIPRGYYGWAVCEAKHVAMVCWMDRTPVLCASAMIGANLAKAGIKRLRVFKKLAMMCPLMIVFYNLFMGGVDGSDRLKLNRHGSLELNIVCNSWVKRFILALFDMAVTNAYVIARFSNPSLTHREFLMNLHKQLLAKAQGHEIPGNR